MGVRVCPTSIYRRGVPYTPGYSQHHKNQAAERRLVDLSLLSACEDNARRGLPPRRRVHHARSRFQTVIKAQSLHRAISDPYNHQRRSLSEFRNFRRKTRRRRRKKRCISKRSCRVEFPTEGDDFLRGLYILLESSPRRTAPSSSPPLVLLFISIALLRPPCRRGTFTFLAAFAEEFMSVASRDPGHRVPHPLIKDCATDLPSLPPFADMSFLRAARPR